MIARIKGAVWSMYSCFYGCGFSGTYDEVMAHVGSCTYRK